MQARVASRNGSVPAQNGMRLAMSYGRAGDDWNEVSRRGPDGIA
jgi:hypothetical protein